MVENPGRLQVGMNVKKGRQVFVEILYTFLLQKDDPDADKMVNDGHLIEHFVFEIPLNDTGKENNCNVYIN